MQSEPKSTPPPPKKKKKKKKKKRTQGGKQLSQRLFPKDVHFVTRCTCTYLLSLYNSMRPLVCTIFTPTNSIDIASHSFFYSLSLNMRDSALTRLTNIPIIVIREIPLSFLGASGVIFKFYLIFR